MPGGALHPLRDVRGRKRHMRVLRLQALLLRRGGALLRVRAPQRRVCVQRGRQLHGVGVLPAGRQPSLLLDYSRYRS